MDLIISNRRGCVSGFQIENMREDLATGTPGEYNWELLDGLTDLPPDMMDKVKTAIVEGKIADEDFKGVSFKHYICTYSSL